MCCKNRTWCICNYNYYEGANQDGILYCKLPIQYIYVRCSTIQELRKERHRVYATTFRKMLFNLFHPWEPTMGADYWLICDRTLSHLFAGTSITPDIIESTVSCQFESVHSIANLRVDQTATYRRQCVRPDPQAT